MIFGKLRSYRIDYSRSLRVGVRTKEEITLADIERQAKEHYFTWEPVTKGHLAFKWVGEKQPYPRDYEGQTWIRAQLASFANHSGRIESAKSTFMGLNCAPQAPSLKKYGFDPIGLRIRQKLESKKFDKVTIYTGTGFKRIKTGRDCSIMAFGMIGKVAVPSHWFQILLFQSTDQNKKINYQLEIYLFPNEDNYKVGTKLHQFHATLEQVYALSEKRFLDADFPGVTFGHVNMDKNA